MGKNSILIVDDDLILLKTAEEILSSIYTVSVAKSGKQAITLLKKGVVPDLILLDIAMPEMDGYTTLEKMKSIPNCQDIPVIFLTGFAESDYEVKGLKAGAVDYIVKPFVKEVLLARVEMHLERSAKGALTTPGTNVPLAIVDMGAGSTDASIKDRDGNVKLVHLAGAGNMVTLLIQSELGLEDFNTAEDIKKYSLAKVESLFHIRHEDGTVQFFEQPLDPNVFAKVVLVKEDGELVPLEGQDSMEKIKMVRTNAKKKVFVTNAIRSLAKVSPTGNVRDIEFVVLVGGSALDFEVPTLVTDALSQYNIVAGRGNIRGCEGPRNAVATGLAMSCADV